MTPKKKLELIESIKTLLRTNGFKEDRWGHFKKIVNEEEIRYKFSSTSLRYEVNHSTGWIRRSSGYFKDLSIVNNKICGLTR